MYVRVREDGAILATVCIEGCVCVCLCRGGGVYTCVIVFVHVRTYVSMHAEMYSVVIEEFVLALSVMCGLYM